MIRNACILAILVLSLVIGINQFFLRERTVILGDGTTQKFNYREELPVNAQNNWARVVAIEPQFRVRSLNPNEFDLGWEFRIEALAQNIRHIRIFDVTAAPEHFLKQDAPDDLARGGIWKGVSPATSTRAAGLNWLCKPETTELFFRIDLKDRAGESRALYQPVLVDLAAKQEMVRQAATERICE